jgi:hypothetical protein
LRADFAERQSGTNVFPCVFLSFSGTGGGIM